MKKLITIVFILSSFVSVSQEGYFSQYFSTPTLINPASIGVIPEVELNSNYNTGGRDATFRELIQATVSYPLRKKDIRHSQFGGVAATFFKESRGFRGIYQSQKLLLTGAYSLKISDLTNQYLSFGLQGGITQTRLDETNLQWGSQFNQYFSQEGGFDNDLEGEGAGTGGIYYPTFNFGVVYTAYDNNNIFVRDRSMILGISADNLNRPVITATDRDAVRKPITFKAFGSGKLELSPRFYLHPSFLTLYAGQAIQINTGAFLTTIVTSAKANTSIQLHTGAWYRVQDSFIVLAGIQFDHIKITGSLDLNASEFQTSELWGEEQPSFEIALTYNFILKKSYQKVSNPIF